MSHAARHLNHSPAPLRAFHDTALYNPLTLILQCSKTDFRIRQKWLQEDVLAEIAKKSGGFALGALIGKGGSKFSGLDIKRVYFGWVLPFLSYRSSLAVVVVVSSFSPLSCISLDDSYGDQTTRDWSGG